MKINYPKILKKNMTNVLKDVLHEIEKNGIKDGHSLYITFNTTNNNIIIPKWLEKKHQKEMTIVIQHEYWNLKVLEEKFEIMLSFNNVKVNLIVPFESIISFADPYANFGLRINSEENNLKRKKDKINVNKKIIKKKNNVIDFTKYKKLN